MTYEEKLEELLAIKCLAHSNKMSSTDYHTFAIRGTGIFVRLTKEYVSPYDPDTLSGYKISWNIKLKKYQHGFSSSGFKSKYANISFEEVLEHKWVSEKARDELLFNLNVFTRK